MYEKNGAIITRISVFELQQFKFVGGSKSGRAKTLSEFSQNNISLAGSKLNVLAGISWDRIDIVDAL